MSYWFVGDSHFGHFNIIKYCKRPFQTVEEMDWTMIKRWNERVSPNDTVYHLGDVSFHRDRSHTLHLLNNLNGKIILIRGNHDKLKSDLVKARFESIHDYLELKINNQLIVMCHYPFLRWNKGHRGSWSIHGHSHGGINQLNKGTRRLDVGVDTHNFYPYSYGEVKEYMTTGKDIDHY